jgi:hypothetical protein
MVRHGQETTGIYLKVCSNKTTMVMYDTNSMYQLGSHIGYLMTFYQLQLLSSITLHGRIFMYG